MVHVDGPAKIELHTIYGTACYSTANTEGSVLLADRSAEKWPVFERYYHAPVLSQLLTSTTCGRRNKHFFCTYRPDGSVQLKTTQNGMLVARSGDPHAVCHVDGTPGGQNSRANRKEAANMTWRTFSFRTVHSTTKLEQGTWYTLRCCHGSLLYAPPPTPAGETWLMCDYHPVSGPGLLRRSKPSDINPTWSHFQIRYVKGPGVIELLTCHGTVCFVPSGELQGGVRCDGEDKPWRAHHETRALLAIYGDEGLFGDDGTVQFQSSSNKILHAPGAAQGARMAADGAIGQWGSGNERKVLTFVKVMGGGGRT